jgi:diguanylate cyclase (GGDEF)-like protein/PAS domain S-box-containing protein
MSKAQVLIVEDEAITAMDIQITLEGLGYEIIGIADTGKEALAFVEQCKPDLIFMDIVVKGDIDGTQAAIEIKKRFNIPIIFLTAYQDDNTFNQAKLSDPYAYLPKPFDKKDLRVAAELALYKHQINKQLVESERRFHNAFTYAATGMALLNLNTEEPFIQVNKSLCSMLGYSEEEMLTLSLAKISYPEDLGLEFEHMEKLLHNKIKFFRLEKRLLHKLEHIVWGAISVSLVNNEKGQPSYYIFQVEDISLRKIAETQVEHLTHHDTLTGLPTRDLLEDFVIQSVIAAQKQSTQVAVLFLGIDYFKRINNTLGHEAGDLLLQAVGARLSGATRTQDFAARLGGDNFVLVLTDISQTSDIITMVQKIQLCFSEPFVINNQVFHITMSIGISLYPTNGEDSKTLIKNGGIALNLAKNSGRNNFQFCTAKMTKNILDRVHLENKIHTALEQSEFVLYYQPQVRLSDGKIVGVEALLRLKQSGTPPSLPKELISIAEETGLIVPIGEWVIRAACEQAEQWQMAGFKLDCISINLSARQFYEPNLLKTLVDITQEHGVNNLDLEITESLLIRDVELAKKQLHFLHKAGFQISLDDFGTGYSSLCYIRQFPINRLKIDQMFVRESTINDQNAALLKAIIILGQTLNLKVIAEGVETVEQLNLLQTYGCDEIQGYYFSKPIPAADITRLLQEKKILV